MLLRAPSSPFYTGGQAVALTLTLTLTLIGRLDDEPPELMGFFMPDGAEPLLVEQVAATAATAGAGVRIER